MMSTRTKKSKQSLAWLVAIAVAWFGLGHEAISGEYDNPYLELYKLRVSQAELNLSRRAALSELADANLARGAQLVTRNAISRQEFDTLTAEARVAAAEKELAGQKIEEAKAYLQIIEGLVSRGVSIPLCTYEME